MSAACSLLHTKASSRTDSNLSRRVDYELTYITLEYQADGSPGWANAPNFPPFKTAVPTPGFDPLIGQAPGNAVGVRSLGGTNPDNQGAQLTLPTDWVVPKGGEYFFSPSIPALKSMFVLSAHQPISHSREL